MASRGRGANRNVGRSGPRPPGLMAWRGQSLQAPVSHCREPASWVRIRKPPRWSAERGPGRPGHRWSRARRRDRRMSAACRRSIHPSSGGRNCCCRDGRRCQIRRRTHKRRHMRRDGQTRTQQRAAGTKNTTLFDIVKRNTANGSRPSRDVARGVRSAHVSRASERQRAKTRDPGASRQNRWTVQTSRHVAPRSRVSLRSPGTRTHCAISRDGVTFPIAGAARPVQRKPTKPPSAS